MNHPRGDRKRSVSGGVWEREKYVWDAAKGHVAVETVDSNTWGPGSRWDYQLTPAAHGGTEIQVTIQRYGKGWKGRLIGLGVAPADAQGLRPPMYHAFARSAC